MPRFALPCCSHLTYACRWKLTFPGDLPVQMTKFYVREDKHGVMRVAQTRVMLDSVVAAFRQGHSAETIQQQYPALTLENVYGAITYYLANKEHVDKYLARQGEVWRQEREKAGKQASEVVQRLRSQAARVGTDGE